MVTMEIKLSWLQLLDSIEKGSVSMGKTVSKILKKQNTCLSIHDFRMGQESQMLYVIHQSLKLLKQHKSAVKWLAV